MRKLKILLAVLLLSGLLSFGSPLPVRAAAANEMPPAIVLVQDRNNKMLYKHNFIFDDGMLESVEIHDDNGFYVPSGNIK